MKDDKIQIHSMKNYLFLIDNEKRTDPKRKMDTGPKLKLNDKSGESYSSREKSVASVGVTLGLGEHLLVLNDHSDLHSAKTYDIFRLEQSGIEDRHSDMSMDEYPDGNFNMKTDSRAENYASASRGEPDSFMLLNNEENQNQSAQNYYGEQYEVEESFQLVDSLDTPSSVELSVEQNSRTRGSSDRYQDNRDRMDSQHDGLLQETPDNDELHKQDLLNSGDVDSAAESDSRESKSGIKTPESSKSSKSLKQGSRQKFIEKNKIVNSGKMKNGSYAKQFAIKTNGRKKQQAKAEGKLENENETENIQSDIPVDPLEAETMHALQELQELDELLSVRTQNSTHASKDDISVNVTSASYPTNSHGEYRIGKPQLPPIRASNAIDHQTTIPQKDSFSELNDLSDRIQSEERFMYEDYPSSRISYQGFIEYVVQQPNIYSLPQGRQYSNNETAAFNFDGKEKQNNYSAQYEVKNSARHSDQTPDIKNSYAAKLSKNSKQPNYKPYTLKDFKALEKSSKLQRSLGPDFNSDTYAEKVITLMKYNIPFYTYS